MESKENLSHLELSELTASSSLLYYSGLCPCEAHPPGARKGRKVHSFAYFAYHCTIVVLQLTTSFSAVMAFVTTKSNFSKMIDLAVVASSLSHASMCTLLWIRFKKDVHYLLKDFKEFGNQAVEIQLGPKQKSLLVRSKYYEKIFCNFTLITLLTLASSVVAMSVFSFFSSGPNALPMPMWPAICDENSSNCFTAYLLFETLAAYSYALTTTGIVSQHICFNIRCVFLFRCLEAALEGVGSAVVMNSDTDQGRILKASSLQQKARPNLINALLRCHQTIIGLAKRNNLIFAPIITVRMVITLPTQALCLYAMAEGSEIDPKYFIINVFLTVGLLQVAVISDLLCESSEHVRTGAWFSDWLSLDRDACLKLKMLMLRAQRPLSIFGSRFVGDITIDSFIQILKASFSFLQALRSLK